MRKTKREKNAFIEGLKKQHFFLKEMESHYNEQEQRLGVVKKIVVPDLHETSLFLMALTFTLLLVADHRLIKDCIGFLKSGFERMIIFIPFFVAGIIWAFYHAFSSKKKTPFAKKCMLLFAVFSNVASGFASAFYMIDHAKDFFVIVFSILNFLNAVFLFWLWRTQELDEDDISDENALPMQILTSGIALGVVFVLCRYVFGLYWAITFSICIVYASNINRILQKTILVISARRRQAEK